ncbi:uncharacterized protein LOC106639324 isoform X1 [Copidosoma floridanum]|uniref:uncharacterized protein LOC106639324 isoform X1 n=1 Tax=Copidosoma floridanum TaxID=29053 RepID=UPI0006C9D6AE|nr:uncharacterized protein LOC106639324 isoform X1 [Copidosoma floridanum]
MQRCPYLHEMKERLLSQPTPTDSLDMDRLDGSNNAGGTPVKDMHHHHHHHHKGNSDYQSHANPGLNSDGYGSHTSPAHARQPLVPQNSNNQAMCLTPTRCCPANNNVPKNAKTSLFIIMSFIYAKLLVVVCVAYVISEAVTYRLPLYYYEGFFTYLYGVSILFLLYVFCFLLQESACCSRGADVPPPQPKPPKQPKEPKDKSKKKDKKDKKDKKEEKSKKEFQERLFQDATDVEAGVATRALRRRKTSLNDSSHGSFFLRIGAIGFGLGTMVYNGLEFGVFFEVPPTSPCYQILQGVNPVLQMIFTFMQMYFIFMNSRLNIHRFKVVARFGLMHVVATNLCVWIRTLVLESIKEITEYHRNQGRTEAGILASIKGHTLQNAGVILGERPRDMANLRLYPGGSPTPYPNKFARTVATTASSFNRMMRTTVRPVARAVTLGTKTTTSTSTITPSSLLYPRSSSSSSGGGNPLYSSTSFPSTEWTTPSSSEAYSSTLLTEAATSTLAPATTTAAATTTSTAATTLSGILTSLLPKRDHYSLTTSPPDSALGSTTTATTSSSSSAGALLHSTATYAADIFSDFDLQSDSDSSSRNNIPRFVDSVLNSTAANLTGSATGASVIGSLWNPSFNVYAEALTFTETGPIGLMPGGNNTCGRVNIMGTIVKDAAPYLFPFIIEYSLIGAAVIYVMWKHIGRHPRSPHQIEADLERKLEAMLSRRAVALAHADESAENNAENSAENNAENNESGNVTKQEELDVGKETGVTYTLSKDNGRMDCVGASKGLFIGLLLLVASLICLILFFVLIHHPDFGLLAIYLADVSHCALMVLSIFAIIVGFCRIQNLKFKAEEQSDLNDILLRVSAFGLFIYAVFSIIAGSLAAFTHEPNLLVMVTNAVAVVQVVLQLLFISDVSRRRVHLPEHDRSKPGRQIVTFLLICNVTMWVIYTFEAQKVAANPVQIDFYGYLPWALVQRFTIPLCIFHRFHSAVTLAEIWKTSYKARLE